MITIFDGVQFNDKKEFKDFLSEMDVNNSVNMLLRAVMSAQSRGAYSTTESRAIDEVIDKIQEQSSESETQHKSENETYSGPEEDGNKDLAKEE